MSPLFLFAYLQRESRPLQVPGRVRPQPLHHGERTREGVWQVPYIRVANHNNWQLCTWICVNMYLEIDAVPSPFFCTRTFMVILEVQYLYSMFSTAVQVILLIWIRTTGICMDSDQGYWYGFLPRVLI